jgi:hypothetical protein
MIILIVLALLPLTLPQTSAQRKDRSGLEVLSLEVKEKLITTQDGPSMVSSQPPVLNPDPAANRGTDRNEPTIVANTRDINQRIKDLRSLENKRGELPSRSKIVGVYESQARMKDNASKSILRFVGAYHLSDSTPDQEFFCKVRIEPGQTKTVRVMSRIPLGKVVNASAAGITPTPYKPTLEQLIINQVQYADGTTWQRANWNPVVLSRLRAKKVDKGKCLAL